MFNSKFIKISYIDPEDGLEKDDEVLHCFVLAVLCHMGENTLRGLNIAIVVKHNANIIRAIFPFEESKKTIWLHGENGEKIPCPVVDGNSSCNTYEKDWYEQETDCLFAYLGPIEFDQTPVDMQWYEKTKAKGIDISNDTFGRIILGL